MLLMTLYRICQNVSDLNFIGQHNDVIFTNLIDLPFYFSNAAKMSQNDQYLITLAYYVQENEN